MTDAHLHHTARRGTTLTRLAAACLVAVLAALPACEPPPEEGTQSSVGTVTRAELGTAASADVARLQAIVAQRYRDHLAGLNDADRAKDQAAAAAAGASGTQLSVEWSKRGVVRSLSSWRMRIPLQAGAVRTPADRAQAFLEEYRALFGLIEPNESLHLQNVSAGAGGSSILRFTQTLQDVRVFGAGLLLHLDANGELDWLAGLVVPESALGADDTPKLNAKEAAAAVSGDPATAVLGWFNQEAFGKTVEPLQLAWRLITREAGEPEAVFVNAHTGEVLGRSPLVLKEEHREVFYCGGEYADTGVCHFWGATSGNPVFDDVCHDNPGGDNDCSCDDPEWCLQCIYPQADCVYTGGSPGDTDWMKLNLDVAYQYYLQRHSRDSWDNGQCGQPGSPCEDAALHRLRASTDCSPGFDCNSAWIPLEYQGYPVAASILEGPGQVCRDVVGHEVTHGVMDSHSITIGNYCTPTAALQEGIADVFGELTQGYAEGAADWFVASCTAEPQSCKDMVPRYGGAIRDLRVSGWTDARCGCEKGYDVLLPTVKSWTDYREDCDGHASATIAGTAGYLAGRASALGAESFGGLSITGIGEVKAGKVWYRTVTELLSSYPSFLQFRNAIVSSCNFYYNNSTLTATERDNCIGAVDAIGVWTPDSSEGISAMGVAPVNFNGRRLLTRNVSDNKLMQSAYVCLPPPFSVCFWSTPTQVSTEYASATPAAASFSPYLWACFRNTSGYLWCDRMDSAGSWTPGPDPYPSPYIVGPPSLAYWNGKLYLAYRKSDGVLYWRYTTGSSWSAEQSTLLSSPNAPVLASAAEDPYPGSDSRLWLVYRSGNHVRYAWLDGSTWTDVGPVGLGWQWNFSGLDDPLELTKDTADRRPSAAMFRGRLHVASTFGDTLFYAACNSSYCGNWAPWSRTVPQEGWSSHGDTEIESWGTRDGRLHLWHFGYDAYGALYSRSKKSE